MIPSARVRVRVPHSETHGEGTRISSHPLPNAEGVAADSPGSAEERGPPGVRFPNDPRTPKAVRRIPSVSGSLSESGSNIAAAQFRHRHHGTRASRSANQLLGLRHDITAPSRIAPVLPTRCFGPSPHAASAIAFILSIQPILYSAASIRGTGARQGLIHTRPFSPNSQPTKPHQGHRLPSVIVMGCHTPALSIRSVLDLATDLSNGQI